MAAFEARQLTLPEFFQHFFANLFQNPFTAFAEGSVLAVVVFALFVGVALVAGGERYRNILQVLQEFLEMLLRIVGWIMRLAPLGILALLIRLVAEQDVALLSAVGGFIVLVFGTTLFHGAVVLPLILYLTTGRSPLWFWRGARDAVITAFATSSSSATLPVSIRCAEENLKVDKRYAGFVLPLGATMNMDGTALYEAAAALFVANLVGVELSLGQQAVVFFTAMIASTGAPGIPRRHGDHGHGAAGGRPAGRGDRHPAADRPPARHRSHGSERAGRYHRQRGGAAVVFFTAMTPRPVRRAFPAPAW